MKRIPIFLSFILAVNFLIAQTQTNFVLPEPQTNYSTRISYDLLYDSLNHYYYSVYITFLTPSSPQAAVIVKMDTNFQVTDSIICQSNRDMYMPSKGIYLTSDSNLIVTFNDNNSNYGSTGYFLKLTPDLDTVAIKVLTPDLIPHGTFNYYDIAPTKDNGYIYVGQYIDTTTTDRYQIGMMKIDSNLDMEWFKGVGTQTSNELDISCVVQAYDGSYLVGGYSYQYEGDNYMVRVDSAGNLIWRWLFRTPDKRDGYGIIRIIQTRDSNFVAIGGKGNNTTDFGGWSDTRLTKFDLNKQVIWDTTYTEIVRNFITSGLPMPEKTIRYFLWPQDLVELSNGDLVFTAAARNFLNYNVWFGSEVFKLNPDGGLIWKRRYRACRYNGGYEPLWDITPMSDGGFTFWGYLELYDDVTNIPYPPSQHLWVVQTDSMGCDGYGSCDTVHLEYLDPLPDTLCKTDTVNIRAVLAGTDYQGAFFIRTYLARLSGYYELRSPYSVTGSYSNVFVGDTIIIPFYDEHNLDSVGYFLYINAMDSSSHYQEKQVFPVPVIYFKNSCPNSIAVMPSASPYWSVYPNPANNQITVSRNKHTGGISAINHLSVFDITGQQVKSQKLKEESSEYVINVADLPAGIYILKLTGDNITEVTKFMKE